ncbi:cadherin domain-containing protein, partial [Stappia sp. F7233]
MATVELVQQDGSIRQVEVAGDEAQIRVSPGDVVNVPEGGTASLQVEGDDLIVSLLEGQVVRLQDFFAGSGEEAAEAPRVVLGGETFEASAEFRQQLLEVIGSADEDAGATGSITGSIPLSGYSRIPGFTDEISDPAEIGLFSPSLTGEGLDFLDAPADAEGAQIAQSTVQVTDFNEAPVAVADANSATEDGPAIAGNVLTNDTDSDGDTLSVSTVSAGGAPVAVGAATVIAGAYGTLTINSDGSYSYVADQAAAQGLGVGEAVDDVFTYEVSDGNGGTDTATLTVTVTGANDAPVITSSASFSVDENTTAVGTVAATDADTNDTVSYSISGGADGALFTIDGATGELSFIASPDFDAPGDAGADNVYEVEVTASDGNGGTSVQTISVTVGDVNEAPTDITLSNASVEENSTNGTVVGTLGAADPDAGESFTYTLLDNAGGRFAIVGNELRVADGGLLDFETATSHQVTVEVEDSAG